MQRAGFVPENADGTPWAAHAHARHGGETALPPAFQEPGDSHNPAGSMAGYSNGAVRMTPQGVPAGAGAGAGCAAPSSSEGLGISAAGELRSSRAASAPTGAGDAKPITGAYGAPGSESGGGRAPPAAAPSLNGTGLSGPAADAGPVPSTVAASRNGAGQGSSIGSASGNGAGQNETVYGSGAGGAVSAEALELGAAAAAAPSSANAVRGCAPQAEAVWERIAGGACKNWYPARTLSVRQCSCEASSAAQEAALWGARVNRSCAHPDRRRAVVSQAGHDVPAAGPGGLVNATQAWDTSHSLLFC